MPYTPYSAVKRRKAPQKDESVTRSKSFNQASIEKYRLHAAGYNASAQFTMPLRQRAVALLALQPGEVVLDVGAGTGLSFRLLRDGVGPAGKVLAFEQSPEMFAQAQALCAREGLNGVNGLGGVWQVCATAETVQLPEAADAVLFNYTHDICRSPEAIANLMRQLKPGARVAMAGMKFFPWWTGPLNLLAWAKNRPYNVSAGDLWHPWDIVASYCSVFHWESTQWGMGYIAQGVVSRSGKKGGTR